MMSANGFGDFWRQFDASGDGHFIGLHQLDPFRSLLDGGFAVDERLEELLPTVAQGAGHAGSCYDDASFHVELVDFECSFTNKLQNESLVFGIPLEGDRLAVPCDVCGLQWDAGDEHFRLVFRPQLQVRREIGGIADDMAGGAQEMDKAARADWEFAEDIAAVIGFGKTDLDGSRIDGGAVALLCFQEVIVRQEALADFIVKLEAFLQTRDGDACRDFVPEGAFVLVFQQVAIEQKAVSVNETAPLDGLADPIGSLPVGGAHDGDCA